MPTACQSAPNATTTTKYSTPVDGTATTRLTFSWKQATLCVVVVVLIPTAFWAAIPQKRRTAHRTPDQGVNVHPQPTEQQQQPSPSPMRLVDKNIPSMPLPPSTSLSSGEASLLPSFRSLSSNTPTTTARLSTSSNTSADVRSSTTSTTSWFQDYISSGREIPSGVVQAGEVSVQNRRKNPNTRRGDGMADEGGEKAEDLCTSNSDCRLTNGCLATPLGVCYKPHLSTIFSYEPHLNREAAEGNLAGGAAAQQRRRTRPSGGTPKKVSVGVIARPEIVCSWQPEVPSQLPELDLGGDNPSPEQVVRNFKHVTGSFFQNWYDWPAPIIHVDSPKDAQERLPLNTTESPPTPLAKGLSLPPQDATPATSIATVRMTGSHQGADLLYKFENICLRANGRLAGYMPDLDSYRGGNEVTSKESHHTPNYLQSQLRKVNAFLSTSVDKLPTPPKWFVDRKLVILPQSQDGLKVHVSHGLQQTGNLIWNIESAFPRRRKTKKKSMKEDQEEDLIVNTGGGGTADDNTLVASRNSSNNINSSRIDEITSGDREREWLGDPSLAYARDDVTTVYVDMSPQHKALGWYAVTNTSYGAFSTMATTSSFAIYDRSQGMELWLKATHPGKSFARLQPHLVKPLQDQLQKHPVCFKEAVVFQACHLHDCLDSRPHSRNAWPMWGFRQPRTQELVAARFRACAAVEHLARGRVVLTGTSSSNKNGGGGVTLFYSWRSTSKKLYNDVALAGQLWEYLQVVSPHGGSRLFQGEMNKMGILEMIALYSSIDILIGIYSSAFMFGFLSPPGSYGLEIQRAHLLAEINVSTGLNMNTWSDYGSMYQANRGYHQVIQLRESNGRAPDVRLAFPDCMLKRMVDSYICLHSAEQQQQQPKPQPKAKPLPGVQIVGVSTATTPDTGGSKCAITQSDVAAAEEETYLDPGGVDFKRSLRLSLPVDSVGDESSTSRRLISLYYAADRITPHFAPHIRWGPPLLFDSAQEVVVTRKDKHGAHHQPHREPQTNRSSLSASSPSKEEVHIDNKKHNPLMVNVLMPKLLLVFACATTTVKGLKAEMAFWRRYASRSTPILVMWDLPCPKINVPQMLSPYFTKPLKYKKTSILSGDATTTFGGHFLGPSMPPLIGVGYAVVDEVAIRGPSAKPGMMDWLMGSIRGTESPYFRTSLWGQPSSHSADNSRSSDGSDDRMTSSSFLPCIVTIGGGVVTHLSGKENKVGGGTDSLSPLNITILRSREM